MFNLFLLHLKSFPLFSQRMCLFLGCLDTVIGLGHTLETLRRLFLVAMDSIHICRVVLLSVLLLVRLFLGVVHLGEQVVASSDATPVAAVSVGAATKVAILEELLGKVLVSKGDDDGFKFDGAHRECHKWLGCCTSLATLPMASTDSNLKTLKKKVELAEEAVALMEEHPEDAVLKAMYYTDLAGLRRDRDFWVGKLAACVDGFVPKLYGDAHRHDPMRPRPGQRAEYEKKRARAAELGDTPSCDDMQLWVVTVSQRQECYCDDSPFVTARVHMFKSEDKARRYAELLTLTGHNADVEEIEGKLDCL